MPDISALSLLPSLAIYAAGMVVIAVGGTRLARLADLLADRTGLGEVLVGALFIGCSTSLPGVITSVVTAAEGHPALAIGNALGGITVQTAFLAIADLVFRRANLEHAAASVSALAQGVLLIAVLTIPLIAAAEPAVTLWGIHPASVILLLVYAAGLRLISRIRDEPMWTPVSTAETRDEQSPPDPQADHLSTTTLWLRFAGLVALTGASGYLIGQASIALVQATGVSETMFGTLFSATSTSIPELVVAIAAVRIGAVGLAVGNILGGNAFDVLFLSAIDVATDGSIYAHFSGANRGTALIAVLMTATVLLGLIRRERKGPAGIGFESVLVLLLYGVSALLVSL